MGSEFLARAGRPIWGGALTLEQIRAAVPGLRVLRCSELGASLVRVRDAARLQAIEVEDLLVFPHAVPEGELPKWPSREAALEALDAILEVPVRLVAPGTRDVELNGREFAALVGTGVLDEVESLRLYRSVPTAEQVARLGRLRRLEVFGSEYERLALPAATLGALPALEACELNFLHIDDEGAVALAENRALAGLTELDLACNELEDAGPHALARSRVFGRLRRLVLSRNPLRDVSPFATPSNLPALEELELVEIGSNPVGSAEVERRFGDQVSLYWLCGG